MAVGPYEIDIFYTQNEDGTESALNSGTKTFRVLAIEPGYEFIDGDDWVGADGTIYTSNRVRRTVRLEFEPMLNHTLTDYPYSNFSDYAILETILRSRYIELDNPTSEKFTELLFAANQANHPFPLRVVRGDISKRESDGLVSVEVTFKAHKPMSLLDAS